MTTNSSFEIKRQTLIGKTTDIYLHRTLNILRNEGVNPTVVFVFKPIEKGVFCGIKEARILLSKILPETGIEVWTVDEGTELNQDEVALRIKAPYGSIGLYTSTISGILSSSTGWATAANQCVKAANNIPVISTSSTYIHPNVASNLDYASIIGGCIACSTTLGAKLAGVTPLGNIPHSLSLILGDTIKAMHAFDKHMPQDVPRIALIDTFKDEAEEALNVSEEFKETIRGICIDTPKTRGGPSPQLIKEIRTRLDIAGFHHVEIIVAGELTPEIISNFIQENTPVTSFNISQYIAQAPTIPFHHEIHEINGHPIARRGYLPGITSNTQLDRIM